MEPEDVRANMTIIKAIVYYCYGLPLRTFTTTLNDVILRCSLIVSARSQRIFNV